MKSAIWIIEEIRWFLSDMLQSKQFVIDKSGAKVIELVGPSFTADEKTIFGEPNADYIQRELEWYSSMSLNVNHIPGGPPEIWKQVADKDGFINSNYGWCVWSKENGEQLAKVEKELRANPYSRRALAIYTRPTMHEDAFRNGMSDFMCTNAVQYLIRDKQLHAVVQMRSNDVVFGYRNDYAWQRFCLEWLAARLVIDVGEIHWQVGSLHVYERHFYLVDHWNRTGKTHITKKAYNERFPKSEWADQVGSAPSGHGASG
jgi:thymidylate synthase